MQTTQTQKAYPALARVLHCQKRMGVLVSGGCDSEVLLRAAADVLGNANTVAFNAVTPFIAKYYTDIVETTAEELNIKLTQVTLELKDLTTSRVRCCYRCKKAIYSTVKAAAEKQNIAVLADGTNLDDTAEYRPGLRAAEELNILHPFIISRMTKADIRELGNLLNMKNPNRPSDSCLATRIPEHTPVTAETLSVIDRIEQPLRPHVKGRLRARVSKAQITLEYQTVDKELVAARERELRTITNNSRHNLTLHENG